MYAHRWKLRLIFGVIALVILGYCLVGLLVVRQYAP
jgi:hypothetical protein